MQLTNITYTVPERNLTKGEISQLEQTRAIHKERRSTKQVKGSWKLYNKFLKRK